MSSTINSEQVQASLDRLRTLAAAEDQAAKSRVREREAALGAKLYGRARAELSASAPLSVTPAIGQLLYALALAARPTLIIEFGASLGCSTIYLASALRDLGHGSIVTTEILPEKAWQAAQNLAEAGLDDLVDIRMGDALETLTDLDRRVDLLFLDGSNDLYLPLLALLEPRLAIGALVIADMSHGDPHHQRYRAHVGDPANGYLTTEIPLDAGLVISAWTGNKRDVNNDVAAPRRGSGYAASP